MVSKGATRRNEMFRLLQRVRKVRNNEYSMFRTYVCPEMTLCIEICCSRIHCDTFLSDLCASFASVFY